MKNSANLLKEPSRFSRFSWGLLAYLLAVIGWGAYVRATGSGAGCGSHWPLCNGEVLPRSAEVETLIEFGHRLTSGIALILVVVLVIWAFRIFPAKSLTRQFAVTTLVLMLTEALLGAGLVLFGLVADNDSLTRAWVMVFHLVNTFLLLGAMALTGWSSSREPYTWTFRGQVGKFWALLLSLTGMMLLGASGAIAALGDTLFPATSLAEALQQDLSSSAHILLRLRLFHPLLAILVALLICFAVASLIRKRPETAPLAKVCIFLVLAQIGVGLANFILLAPVWLQIVHLAMADCTWIALVLVTASAATEGRTG